MEKEKQLNLKVETATMKMLKERAYQRDISVAAIVRAAIDQYFKNEESEVVITK